MIDIPVEAGSLYLPGSQCRVRSQRHWSPHKLSERLRCWLRLATCTSLDIFVVLWDRTVAQVSLRGQSLVKGTFYASAGRTGSPHSSWSQECLAGDLSSLGQPALPIRSLDPNAHLVRSQSRSITIEARIDQRSVHRTHGSSLRISVKSCRRWSAGNGRRSESEVRARWSHRHSWRDAENDAISVQTYENRCISWRSSGAVLDPSAQRAENGSVLHPLRIGGLLEPRPSKRLEQR